MAENLNTLYYSLGLDDIEMQNGLKKAIQNLSVLDEEFNKIQDSISKTFGKGIGTSPIHNEIKGLKGELQSLEKQWGLLSIAEKRGAQGQEIRTKYDALRKDAGNLTNTLSKLYNESQKAGEGQRGLAAQLGMVNKELTLQGRLASNVKTLFTSYISIFAVKSFIQNLAQVRGEFELQQVSLRAILRDAEAADKIFGQIKSFSVVSPFEFKDLVGYAKQLSAFQVPVDELFDTTKRLADVSAGLGVGMDRIILAYGQVKAATVLRGQELRQFTEAGIPLVDELAKKFSELEGRVVSAGDVFEKIGNRMVSFEMVKDIFADLTNEGGMFYMMQEKQAESLKGKIANLTDAYAIMLNSIGEANDGILKGGVEGLTKLMENWRGVANALKVVVATYGTYKAAVIALNISDQISKYGSLTKAVQSTTAATKLLNSTLLTNPWILAAVAVAAVGTAMYNSYQEANRLRYELEKIGGDQLNGVDSAVSKFDELSKALFDSAEGSQKYRDIISQINRQYGEYLPNLLNEKNALTELKANYDLVTDAIYNKAKAQAYEKGATKIQEEFSGAQQDYTNILIENLSTSGMTEKSAKDLIALYKSELEKQVGEYNPIDLFNKVYQGYFQTAEKYFSTIGNLANEFKEGIPFVRSDSWGAENARTSLVKYSQVWDQVNKSTKEYSDYIDTMFSKTGYKTQDEAKIIGEISDKYDKLKEDAHNAAITQDEYNESLKRLNVEKLKETLAYYEGVAKATPELTRQDVINNLKAQIKALDEISVKWKEIVKTTIGKDKAGYIFNVSEGEDQFDYLDRLDKEYKKLTAQQELIDKNLVTSPETIEATKTQLDLLKKIGEALNYNFKVDTKAEKKEENPRIQLLNKELDLIKKAKDDYDKLAKWQSQVAANENIKTIYGIDFNEKDVESRAKDVISKIAAINKKEGDKTQLSFDKWFGGDKTDKIIDNLKKVFDSINKQVDSYKGKYDFYEQILGVTGDKTEAIKIAFDIEADEIDLSEYLAGKIKEAGTEAKIDLNFDVKSTESIKEQLGSQYETLTDSIKKMIDEVDAYNLKKQRSSYLDYLKLIQTETPQGTGVTFDFSRIVAKMKTEVGKIQNELATALTDPGKKLGEEEIKLAKDVTKARIKGENEVARQKIANLGSSYLEESLKNKQLWNDYSKLSDASLGNVKKMIEEISRMQSEAFSGEGLFNAFKSNKLVGAEAGIDNNDAFRPLLGDLQNSENVDEMESRVIEMLNNINTVKEGNIGTDERINNLTNEQRVSLELVLSLIKSMSASLNAASKNANRIKFDKTIKMAQQMNDSVGEIIDSVDGLSDAFGIELGGASKEAMEAMKKIGSATVSTISTIGNFVRDSGQATLSAALTAKTGISMVEKASVILAVISAALQIATAIANVFTGNKTKKADEAIEGYDNRLQSLKTTYDDLQFAQNKFYTLEADKGTIDKWLKTEQKAIKDRYGYLIKFGDKGKNYLNKMLSDAQRKADDLQGKSYLQVEMANMKQQEEAIRNKIEAAQGDNKKSKRDDEIKGYQNDIAELAKQRRDVEAEWYETLRGTNKESAANDFATSWVDAFLQGEDAMDGFKEKFDEMMKTMIVKQAAMRVMSKILQPLFDQIDKAIGEGGELNPQEVQNIVGKFPGIIDQMDESMNAIIKPLLEAAGLGFGSAAEKGEGLSEGIKGITEDTAQLLASYLNAIRGSVLLQELYMKNIDLNVAGIYQAMGGSPTITTTTTIPPEIIAAISEPFKRNNELLTSIDLNIGNMHSIAANCQAQLVMIQANTFNNATATLKILERLDRVIRPGHPKGGDGINVWA